LLLLFRALDRSQLDEHRPLAHHPTKRSNQLADLALGLANRGQEDTEAVRQLVAAAGRHRRELRRAAAGIRFTGWADESIAHDRANRLLLAAARNQPVQPPSPEKMERLRTLKSLQEGELDSGYEFLAIRQPALRQLDRDVRNAGAQQPETSVELRERILWDTFGERIAALVGTETHDAPDPIFRTITAALLVNRYLSIAFGLPDPVTGDDA
jgi:hypothetical protein